MTAPTMPTAAALPDELATLLATLTDRYRTLLQLCTEHRDAIRRADGPAIHAAAERQTEVLRQVGSLEQQRRALVAAAIAAWPLLKSRPANAVTLGDIAACTPEPERTALLKQAAELKSLIVCVHEHTRTIRSATESLVAHLEGIVRQVARQLSHAGTYSRRGCVEAGGAVTSSLDLRS